MKPIARAAVAALAFTQGAFGSDPENFQLESLAVNGPYNNSGLFFLSFHVGAGASAAVGIRKQSDGDTFTYNITGESIYVNLGGYPYYLDFNGVVFNRNQQTFPKGYYPMGINIEQAFMGFTFNEFNKLQVGSNAPSDFKALAVCHNDKFDGVAGSGPQLFYRFSATKSPKCSDVNLRAIE